MLSCPAPRSPTRPTTSPACSAAVDRADVLHGHRLQPETRHAFPARRPAKHLRWLAADDQQDRLFRGRLRHEALAGDAAVTQHHHPVRDLEDLVQPVRDVDHSHATVAQPAQGREQPAHLVGRQARGRLVENEDLRCGRQRARDRHQRFLGPAEALNAHVRIDVRANDVERRARALPCRAPIHHAETPRIAKGEADVLRNGHPVDQSEILMDERNRQVAERAGRIAPAERYAARIQRVDAGEDLDERGLAGAVLAEQRQDLAGADLEVNVIKRERAAKALGYAPEPQHRCALRAAGSNRRQSRRRGARHTQSPPIAASAHRRARGPFSRLLVRMFMGAVSECPRVFDGVTSRRRPR